jgi:hypothetical protein
MGIDWCKELEQLETEDAGCGCPGVPGNLAELIYQLQPKESFGDRALKVILSTLANRSQAILRSYSDMGYGRRKPPVCRRYLLRQCGIANGTATRCLRKPKRGCMFYWKGKRTL